MRTTILNTKMALVEVALVMRNINKRTCTVGDRVQMSHEDCETWHRITLSLLDAMTILLRASVNVLEDEQYKTGCATCHECREDCSGVHIVKALRQLEGILDQQQGT